jgi:predicted dienelactone hydrolase
MFTSPFQHVPHFQHVQRRARAALSVAALLGALVGAPASAASLGVTTLPALGDDGPVTVFYPTAAPEDLVQIGSALEVSVARNAAPALGNGRLVVISHGSGGGPWVHSDLARRLVGAGFVVAVPRHHADNAQDHSRPGPDSWTLRPGEVSRAIDAVAADERFAGALRTDAVGVYGMSAGGHAALTLAGGAWSPARFRAHCLAHLAEDFATCVGLITSLSGGSLDGLKLWGARPAHRLLFRDAEPRTHHDPRVQAVVAAVPLAADYDMTTLQTPRVPLGLVTAGGDRWLKPAFHSSRVLQACTPCEHLADLPQGGHGAYLSPLPRGLTGVAAALLNDPPGFDRSQLAEIDERIVGFFRRHLLDASVAARTAAIKP